MDNLDLTRKQRVEIRKVMFDLKEKNFGTMEDRKTIVPMLSEDGKFKKEDFINNRTKISKAMATAQATMLEKVLNILDKDQRKIVVNKLSLLKDN